MDLKQILTRRKASEHPRGANCWSQLLPIGLTRLEFSNHTLWPLLGLQGHQKGLFWPKRSLYGAPEGTRGPLGARFDPNCRQLVRLGWNHSYHKFWAGIGPPFGPRGAQRRPVMAQNDPFWPQKGQYGAKIQNVANLSCGQLAREGHPANEKKSILPILNLVLYWAPCGSKRDIYDQDGYFWGPWGSRKGPTPGKSVL